MILIGWIHFWYLGEGVLRGSPRRKSAMGVTVVMFLAIAFFLWYALFFYQKSVQTTIDNTMRDIEEVELNKRKLSIWAQTRVYSVSSDSRAWTFKVWEKQTTNCGCIHVTMVIFNRKENTFLEIYLKLARLFVMSWGIKSVSHKKIVKRQKLPWKLLL